MPKKIRLKTKPKKKPEITFKIHKRWWIFVFGFIAVFIGAKLVDYNNINGLANASGCLDLKVIYARGSGGERYVNGDYLSFKTAMETKLAATDLKYEFEDLDYPAVSVDIGAGHLGTLLGAYFGSGEAYEFGDSVRKGVNNLVGMINGDMCKNTKYVIAGYSQGALVALNGLGRIDPERIIFVATFGDPKIYLPEGAGMVPSACAGRNLSEYRIYVPDCRAYKGIMGAKNPYVNSGYDGKIGTWCNRYDVMCSSHFSVSSHTSYESDGIYEDASRYIFSKIGAEFGISNQYTSPHDTAILIDSTGSMSGLIERYKTEALRLAEKTLEAGGRVALYDYRDLDDGYEPVERCNFETCNLATFQAGLEAIETDGGGDTPESLLSASFQVMKKLKWKFGSTKSLVILTDAGYHSPDLDGTTFYDVQKLSKQIDPVNFYIITPEVDEYLALAEATGGAVASSVDDLIALTDIIMERYDSLPRVEEEFEDENYENDLPVISEVEVVRIADDSVKISFQNSGEATVVILNEAIVGTTYEKEITIMGLKPEVENKIVLAPLSATRRGEGVEIDLGDAIGGGLGGAGDVLEGGVGRDGNVIVTNDEKVTIPKAPNTGKR